MNTNINASAPEEFHHEWRTPLTVIKTMLQVLQHKRLSVDQDFLSNSLTAAIKAIDRLEALGKNITGNDHR